jgi:lysozyme
MRVLKLGCVGADVANWQKFLISRHLDPGGIDGDYGNRTKTATEQFQQEGALVVDGIVGDATVAAAIPLGFQTSPNRMMIDTIIDIFHQNNIDFDRVKAAGIVAIIHKATEGSRFTDGEYQNRRARAKELGFLWGAYHFASGEDPAHQIENFITHAKPKGDELVALDFEPSSSGPNMTLEQAHQFVLSVQDELGRPPVIYGGSMLREALGSQNDATLASCPLWYARYSGTDMPIGIPRQVWPTFSLWQYTDGDNGSEPRTVDGIGRCDRNRFVGTEDDLRRAWPLTKVAAANG